MKLGKVLGRVVSTVKHESLDGIKLLLVQPLDENLNNAGDPIVAADNISSGIGDIIYYETSKEASRILEYTMNPIDAAVMGIVDNININNKSS